MRSRPERGQEALEQLRQNPDIGVAILDIMLPDIDGFEVCRSIRATNKQIGIIMLTARTQEMDKVTGLMTGADDYVTKPFSPAELTARIDALYRRLGGDGAATPEDLTYGPFRLNTRNRTLEKDGVRIKPDPGGVRHYEALHAKPRPRPLPGGNPGHASGGGTTTVS